MPVLAIGLLALCTACKQDKPLQLQGVWQEESYWTPNDTIAADTLIRTYTLRHITFDCNGKDFSMELTTYHAPIAEDPALSSDSYTEYVKGEYKTVGKTINLDGYYYPDNNSIIPADSNTTPYTWGPYKLEGSFTLDDKRLILTPTSTENTTSTVFSQVQALDCYY